MGENKRIPTPKELEREFAMLASNWDIEVAHIRADERMIEILKAYGYEKAMIVFENMDRWYA